MNILIVDDHEENLYLLESLLRGCGHNVRTASNGVEALWVLASGGIDLIISDILMPVMDGFQFCRKVKTDDTLRAIPFIIYTATYTGPQDEAFALKIGADRFIEKPCEPAVFMAAVDEVVAASKHRGGACSSPPIEEEEALALYSERLVRKLEQKVTEAEREVRVRQEAEQSLRESEARLVAAQRLARLGDFTWDVETGEVTWSEALYELLGYDMSEAIDYEKVNAKIHHPDDLADVTQWLNTHVASGKDELSPKEYRVIRRDGEVLCIRTVGSIQQRPGRRPVVFATVQDITERKKAQEDREHFIAELECKNAELERFVYTVSHDLKAPLITISGFVGLLKQHAEAGATERMNADMDRIINAANKMAELLDNLLEMSRIGRMVNPSETIPMSDLALEAVEMMAGGINARGVDVTVRPELPLVVGDRKRLTEMVVNLIDNAVKYMGDQAAPHIEIGAEQRAAETVFYVRDNGIGIQPRFHDRVFGLFTQLDPNVEGSGIGLALAKRIVEFHGGRIWVESEGPNRGSMFCFTLTNRDRATPEPRTAALAAPRLL